MAMMWLLLCLSIFLLGDPEVNSYGLLSCK